MTFRVVRTNQYNQDFGLIHSTNGNHLESPNEGSSIDHQVTIYLHAQNITMFPTNETCWYLELAIAKRCRVNKLERQRFAFAIRSADGLALMTSSVTSSLSADDLREQSQESADSAGRLCVDISAAASYSGSSRNAKISRRSVWYPDACNNSIQSRASLNQLLLRIQSLGNSVASYSIQSQDPDARKEEVAKRCILSQAEASSRKISSRKLIYSRSAIEEVFDEVGHCEDIAENKSIAQCTNRGKMKRKTKQSTAIREELFTLGNKLIYSRSAIEEVFDEVGHCEDIAENKSIAQCTNRGKMKRKTKQSTAIREELFTRVDC
ncbi:Chromodomain-helicase-DNA-binding protein [Dorcoceras hygrometricum]|uniref:Chromodomain-helicase-DNA-binding protein n=1 Tax=Dorcoceras hygrometricum TaxID=472368 RepID=A0A2Z7APC7_9LAMI|nr:Chromodomain-helicase-DNA-binding protein [Dorcoceras hygrometricum]